MEKPELKVFRTQAVMPWVLDVLCKNKKGLTRKEVQTMTGGNAGLVLKRLEELETKGCVWRKFTKSRGTVWKANKKCKQN